MPNYIVYKKNLLYMALYLKSSIERTNKTSITNSEFKKYLNLVETEIQKQQRIANNFTYEIIDQDSAGRVEPIYRSSPTLDALLKSANISYDSKTDSYITNSSARALSLKSNSALPNALSCCWLPDGFEQALGIDQPEPGDN